MSKETTASTITDTVEERAFAIYRDMSRAGITHEGAALEAFKKAVAFEAVLNKIKSGELSADPVAPKPRKMVKVKLQRAKNDGTGFHDVTDLSTGEPIYKELPCDPHAYCPNVPLDHPANQRFVPEDGIPLQKRVAEFRKHVRASVN